jgi:hypothetical protein
MPYSLIQSVLGLSFVLIWVFIASMIFRDRQIAIRGEQNGTADEKPVPQRTAAPSPARERDVPPSKRNGRRRNATAA